VTPIGIQLYNRNVIELASSEEGDQLPSPPNNLPRINEIDSTPFREDHDPDLEEPPQSACLSDIDTLLPTLLPAGVVPYPTAIATPAIVDDYHRPEVLPVPKGNLHDHIDNDTSFPIVSQTQSEYGADSLCDPSDEEDNPITASIKGSEKDDIATHVNTVFDQGDDYLAAELHSITNHRCLSGVLEFKVEYSNGDLSWHPIDLVKDEDPHAVANYIIKNDLGPVYNNIHNRWARLFLRSLRLTLRRLRRTYILGFEATTFNPVPTNKKRRSRRYVRAAKTAEGAGNAVPASRRKKKFLNSV
jgi:hypothetical protein